MDDVLDTLVDEQVDVLRVAQPDLRASLDQLEDDICGGVAHS